MLELGLLLQKYNLRTAVVLRVSTSILLVPRRTPALTEEQATVLEFDP